MEKENEEAERIIKMFGYRGFAKPSQKMKRQLNTIALKHSLLHVQGLIDALKGVKSSFPIQIEISVEYWQKVKQIIESK